MRIFTGAPVPEGADRVVIQEDVSRDGDRITLRQNPRCGTIHPPRRRRFRAPGPRWTRPALLRPADIALLAAMNIADVPVARRPVVALIATGDELVMPGEAPGPDQIIASNTFGLKAMLEAAGAIARLLPIARDNVASLDAPRFELAEGADLIVTIGGASVGDHDLVAPVAEGLGMERAFYKIAMRPGKPLMAGRLGEAAMLGLPGNPVSAMVCGHLFVVPMLRAMLGLGAHPAPRAPSRRWPSTSAQRPARALHARHAFGDRHRARWTVRTAPAVGSGAGQCAAGAARGRWAAQSRRYGRVCGALSRPTR